MKTIRLASALAVAAGLFAADASATTTNWWEFTFNDTEVADFGALTNANEAAWTATGVWEWTEGDESGLITGAVTNTANPTGVVSQYLKLDTQGNELTWKTKAAARPEGTRTLIDADMQLVGAEDEPSQFDNGDVQAAIFLKNIPDENDPDVITSKLCVYTYDGDQDKTVWVPLDAAVTDGGWYHVQVVVDYSESVGKVSVFVDGTQAADENGGLSWPIASNSDQVKHITSVSFKGTGAIDNFVGAVEATASVSYLFTGATFLDGAASADAPQYISPTDPSIVGTPVSFETDTILFDAGDMSATLTSVVITTFDGEGVATNTTYAFEYDENEGYVVAPAGAPAGMFVVDSGLLTITAPTDNATAGAGTNEIQIVQIYYTSIGGGELEPVEPGDGMDPTVDGLPVEMLAAGTELEPGVPLAEDTFAVRFCGQAGVTYQLIAVDAVDADWDTESTVADEVVCAADGDVITLTDEMDEDAQFYKIKAIK